MCGSKLGEEKKAPSNLEKAPQWKEEGGEPLVVVSCRTDSKCYSLPQPPKPLAPRPSICPRNAQWEWRALSQVQKVPKGPSGECQAGCGCMVLGPEAGEGRRPPT